MRLHDLFVTKKLPGQRRRNTSGQRLLRSWLVFCWWMQVASALACAENMIALSWQTRRLMVKVKHINTNNVGPSHLPEAMSMWKGIYKVAGMRMYHVLLPLVSMYTSFGNLPPNFGSNILYSVNNNYPSTLQISSRRNMFLTFDNHDGSFRSLHFPNIYHAFQHLLIPPACQDSTSTPRTSITSIILYRPP